MVVLGWGRDGEGAGAQPGLGAASLHQPCPRRCCASQPGWEKQPGPGGCLHRVAPQETAGEGAMRSLGLWLPCQEGRPLFIPEHPWSSAEGS